MGIANNTCWSNIWYLKYTKKTPRVFAHKEEDRQAFGVLVGKAATLEEAFTFPITSIPLSLATPEGSLRQSDKASLRNYLIKQAEAVVDCPPKRARWIIDGMALFRIVKPKDTYREWFVSVLRCASPPKEANPSRIEIVNERWDLSRSIFEKRWPKNATREAMAKFLPQWWK